MDISEELKKFIEDQFVKMLLYSKELDKERSLYTEQKPKIMMKRKRAKDKEIKKSFNLYIRFGENIYQSARKEIEDYHQSTLAKEGNVKQNPLKGKATVDFNNFLCFCYYLIKKEGQNQKIKDIEVYKWLEQFLEDKKYIMKDGKNPYDNDAIKTRIKNHDYYKNPQFKEYFQMIFDTKYNDFLLKNFPVFPPMIIK